MLTTVEAVIENGQIRFMEDLPLEEGTRLIITVLPLKNSLHSEKERCRALEVERARTPKTSLGARMRELRIKILESDGPMMTLDDINFELDRNRYEQ